MEGKALAVKDDGLYIKAAGEPEYAMWVNDGWQFYTSGVQDTEWGGDPFQLDPLVPRSEQPAVKGEFSGSYYPDGTQTWYDRGHICASQDRMCSQQVNEQTFYMTNMMPQVNTFNSGIWSKMESKVRYWAIPGQEGYTHILGGLEKDGKTGAISTDPENHDLMCRLRQEKVDKIPVPDLEVTGDVADADLLIVGFGSTYGHLVSAMQELQGKGYKVAQAQFKFINPLPANTASVLSKYKKVVVAEQNLGQLAAFLRAKVDGFVPYQFNQVKGQPFVVSELVDAFEDILKK